MQKIIPHLWFDTQAKEAAEFYCSAIPNSKINSDKTIHNTPSGDSDIVSFEVAGFSFMAISAGPVFTINPSISFHIKCTSVEEVDAIWSKLEPGGKVLMELGSYPFSERYGWVQDKYGVSWQVIHAGDRPFTQKITPVLMFVGERCGKAEEAINFYTSLFKNSSSNILARYGANQEPDKEGTVMYASFTLEGIEFGAMDSAHKHEFNFNEAVSLIVMCEDQQEIDYFWSKLSAVPESEQCGWLKDKFGVSWQITPTILGELLNSSDQAKVERVTQAFLQMKKFDIEKLKQA
jgi:predicted 3-demethylubiquinone-9 3-methyltransferase (glyoxalase superfamily)